MTGKHRAIKIIGMLLFVLVNGALQASPCTDNRVRLQVLGSGGPELGDGRASSSYLVWINGKAEILVDAGPGSSYNFEKTSARFEDLKAILLTHLHVDHSADIPAYIKASYFTRRNRDLLIFGPQGNALMPATTSFIRSLFGKQGAYRYLNEYINRAMQSDYHLVMKDIPLSRKKHFHYRLTGNIQLEAVTVHHGPVAAIAWRVDTGDCSITFTGDMNNQYGTVAALARSTDMLVAHNAVPESARGIAANLHMRPSTIGRIAKQANVKLLLLSHRMLRTLGREKETRHYIRQHYKGKIRFANDLDVFALK